MIIYYDIDGTLTDPIGTVWNPDHDRDDFLTVHGKDWIMPPDLGRLADLRVLHEAGHRIVIWSCRTNPVVMGLEPGLGIVHLLVGKVAQWLEHYNIPYDHIERTPKPFFTHLVDDRALNPDNMQDMVRLRYAAIKRYVEHDPECGSDSVKEPWSEDRDCTCGLAEHLNKDWELNLNGGVRGGGEDT